MIKNISNNLFMLCKFITDAIQLFFFRIFAANL